MLRRSRLVECSVSVYRLLLAAYPAAFRQEYGEAMTQLFRDTAHDAYLRGGLLGLVMVWLRTLADFTFSVIRLHGEMPVEVNSESGLLRDFLQKWRRFGSEALSVTAFSAWYGMHLLRLYFRRATLVWATLTTLAFGIWLESFVHSIWLIRERTLFIAIDEGIVLIWHLYDVGQPISEEQCDRDIHAWLERNPRIAKPFNYHAGPWDLSATPPEARLIVVELVDFYARPWELTFNTDLPGGNVIGWQPTAPDHRGKVRHKRLIQPYKFWRLRFPFGLLPALLLGWTIRVYLRRNTGSVVAMQSA